MVPRLSTTRYPMSCEISRPMYIMVTVLCFAPNIANSLIISASGHACSEPSSAHAADALASARTGSLSLSPMASSCLERAHYSKAIRPSKKTAAPRTLRSPDPIAVAAP